MAAVLEALEELKSQPWYQGQVTRIEPLGSRDPTYAEPSFPLPEPLERYLAESGVSQLYCHQVELLEACRQGKNAIITTGTSSGKTLGFNLPVVEALLASPAATALYLYPMKAVTQDQLRVLMSLESRAGVKLSPAIYDGDTPKERRSEIRRRSRIVLSNPYELHQILPYHYQWSRFYKNLRFCVVDEAHEYRGIFGSNVAQLMRRLRRICRLYGSSPRFILSSASIANPEELARKLTGLDFVHVSADGAPRGRGWLVFYNPCLEPATSVHVQTQRLVAHFSKLGLQTLCFVQSRRLAELVGRWVKQEHPELMVASYRAGYLPSERRKIEAELASGRLRGVVSTDALELGINIGSLDCVIAAGYPGTLASLWQQAGRAGRELQDSLVVFVGFPDALNQYLLRHPELVMAREFESAVLDLTNPYILKGHLLCAASESPIQDAELGPEPGKLLTELEADFQVRRTPSGWVYTGQARPQETTPLDAIEEQTFEVVCEGELLESMDLGRAYREAHQGAVLLHRGETYLVRSFDLEHRRAEVKKAPVDYHTQVIQRENLRLLESRSVRELAAGFRLILARVQATQTHPGYQVRRFDRVITTHPLDLPPIQFNTVGLWLELTDSADSRAGGLHGVEHALIALAPLIAMCDRGDIGGTTYPCSPDTSRPTIVIYDGYPEGIGIAEKLFDRFDDWARRTFELVQGCGCADGCPSCVLSPQCGDSNQPMDKRAALELLRLIAPDRSALP